MAIKRELAKLNQALTGELTTVGPLTPLKEYPTSLTDPRGELFFSRYKEDSTLRLYKGGSLISDEPAGYADQKVTVKVLVVRKSERFMVALPVTRQQLAHPDAEKWLAEAAWEHRG